MGISVRSKSQVFWVGESHEILMTVATNFLSPGVAAGLRQNSRDDPGIIRQMAKAQIFRIRGSSKNRPCLVNHHVYPGVVIYLFSGDVPVVRVGDLPKLWVENPWPDLTKRQRICPPETLAGPGRRMAMSLDFLVINHDVACGNLTSPGERWSIDCSFCSMTIRTWENKKNIQGGAPQL